MESARLTNQNSDADDATPVPKSIVTVVLYNRIYNDSNAYKFVFGIGVIALSILAFLGNTPLKRWQKLMVLNSESMTPGVEQTSTITPRNRMQNS
jgi:hypothetical protein